MEEEKAAAYYDELTRKGEGAARFKQGLGFSANKDGAASPSKGSALPSSTASSFLSNFVKASSPTQASKFEKQAQLESIQNKLKKKREDQALWPRVSVTERSSRESGRHRHRSRSRSRERDRERNHRKPSRSRSRERNYRRRSRSRERNYRRRSRSRERYRDRDRERRRNQSERRSRSRSFSPREGRRLEKRGDDVERERAGKEKNGSIDYSRLIEGYEKMTAAERVKARMKLQLKETAKKDEGMGSGWERFAFDKDAPLDDEEVEAAEDDTALVKHIGQSFRFSAVEARREEQIKAAHDDAMFGAPSLLASGTSDNEIEVDNNRNESKDTDHASSLLSEKVLAKQQGSWRDRARKL